MKKFLTLLLAAVLCFSMAACGGSNDSANNDSDVTRVAILLPYLGDQSYLDVTANAKVLLDQKYGSDISVNVVQMGMDEADWEPANMQAANEGYDIIVSGNWQYEGAMLSVAAEYPEISYLNFDYSDANGNALDNVYAITYAAHEIGYLVGAVAGVKSQTGIIGGLAGKNAAGMNQFMAGFIQGAADANPEIKVMISYVGSYEDPVTAKEQSMQMINAGADILWGCAGGSGNGVFEAVAEARKTNKNIWAMGVDSDQYVSMSAMPELADAILTSGLKKVDVAVTNAVEQMLNGTAPFGTQKILGYADGAVGLAENEHYLANMTEAELAAVKALADKVADGTTVVVDEVANPGVFEKYYNQYGLK
ncbi:MAG: BMP family ABC transporter substrate-binding protein [Erysipelotrichaceae bacterium]|nr:BMP family ABC transporter substrate-binding protein [Erysipelotrichaceae bacterium]